MRVNAHAIMFTNRQPPAYHAAIRLSDERRGELIEASQKVRQALRENFKNGFELLVKGLGVKLYESDLARAAMRQASKGAYPELAPRFYRQGSIAYDLALEPCHPGTQEVDIDDGVYFPMSFVDGDQPALTVQGMFRTVEIALKELCAKEGWTLLDSAHPKRKENCVRILLNNGAHLDLPLYAIPNEQFAILEKRIAEALHAQYSLENAIQKSALDPELVQLAHRTDGWIASDPRILNDWFKKQQAAFSQLRPICRYLKGWRDFTWPKGGPSSICLMACAVEALQGFDSSRYEDRHDLLLLKVTEQLPSLFQGQIPNPAAMSGAASLDAGWDEVLRAEYVEQARQFSGRLEAALTMTADSKEIVRKLKRIFGDRIPEAFWAIVFGSSATAKVMGVEPDTQPLAQVKPHTSA